MQSRRLRKKGNQGDHIASEADKLFKSLLDYAKVKRGEGVYDFTEILSSFYKQLLANGYADKITNRNTFTKRFMKMIKEYIETDPRDQSRIDEFA